MTACAAGFVSIVGVAGIGISIFANCNRFASLLSLDLQQMVWTHLGPGWIH
jgi:hypothetical protein